MANKIIILLLILISTLMVGCVTIDKELDEQIITDTNPVIFNNLVSANKKLTSPIRWYNIIQSVLCEDKVICYYASQGYREGGYGCLHMTDEHYTKYCNGDTN